MDTTVSGISSPPLATAASALVIGCHEGALDGHPLLAEVDDALGGSLQRMIATGGFKGECNETASIPAPAALQADVIVLVGLGKAAKWTARQAYQAAGSAAKALAKRAHPRVAYYFPPGHAAEAISGAMTGCQGQDLYAGKRKLHPFGEILWHGAEDAAVLRRGEVLGTAMNLARRLVNEPAAVIYPESFARECTHSGRESGFEVEVWDETRLEEEKCRALLAVARASANPPRLVIMRYRGDSGSDVPPLCLVGKGVTFDSGGLSLKPSDGMQDMKCDMAGAATVLAAMQAIARLQLPVNVTGLVGLVENMVSGSSYKLGDVLAARGGKTIEVLNTDAEGRLVLADVLDVAVRDEKAARVVDLATLTGACMVALGLDIAGAMTNDDAWCGEVLAAAARTGERAWQLPMDEEFNEHIKSEVADIKNIGNGRWGGAITAAKLLEAFVGDTPWVHLDIAGPAFSSKAKTWIDGGGSGVFVRTLVELASGLKRG